MCVRIAARIETFVGDDGFSLTGHTPATLLPVAIGHLSGGDAEDHRASHIVGQQMNLSRQTGLGESLGVKRTKPYARRCTCSKLRQIAPDMVRYKLGAG
jgi:hypothetical protein